jgi:hypothetical protein
MTTTAQTALKAFEDAWITINYIAMTSAQKTTHIQTHYDLKIKVVKEIEANRVESEIANTAAQTANLADSKSKLQSLGYLCDNSQADWNKLYDRPKLYGINWQQTATYQKSISTGVEYFISKANEVLYISYEIDTPYKIGNTFQYNGQLYEVIQAHVSQADWNPETTLALYKKAVATGVIPDWVQPIGSQDAYKIGDKVKFNGTNWESLINANVWSPTAYPAGWKSI